MKKNGFTLIELLAVIIILAVIALIATPIVLNVVDNAKNKALENSAYGIVDAAKFKYLEGWMDGTSAKTGNAADLIVAGEKATAGTWTVVTESTNADEIGIKIEGIKFASSEKTCTNFKDGKVGNVVCE